MEPPSAPPCRVSVPWQGLLLSVSLLTFWNLPTTAQLTIESVPANAVEGSDVLLLAHNLPENLQGYYWYKGESAMDNQQIALYVIATQETRPGSVYSGREKIYPNGSLLFQNVTQNDTGFYTLQTLNISLHKELASVQLHVYELVTKPSINTTTNTTVTEQGSVVLICVSYDTGISIRWIFNNQSLRLTERMTLSEGNSTLSIDPVRREDDGEYQCEVYNMVSSRRSDSIRLAVICLGTSDNSPNKVDEVSYSSLIFNTREPKQPIPALSVSTAAETVYLEVKRK
uniref:Carcinoembryonic antigen-related cell adhesion molecule 2 n=1 Tax=Castor canadensis TaxID=51338 RepID=A0A250YEF2_CASCN